MFLEVLLTLSFTRNKHCTHRCFRSPVERPSEPDRINGLGIEEVAALRLLLQRLRRALQPVDV